MGPEPAAGGADGLRAGPRARIAFYAVSLGALAPAAYAASRGGGLAPLALAGGFAGFGFFLLTLRKPFLPFLALVLLLPFEGAMGVPRLPNPVLILFGGMSLALALLSALFGGGRSGRGSLGLIRVHGADLLLLLFALWLAVTALVADGPGGLLTSARPYFLLCLLFLLASRVLRTKERLVSTGAVLALSLAMAGLLVLVSVGLFLKGGGSISGAELHRFANTDLGLGTSAQNLTIWLAKGIPFGFLLSDSRAGLGRWFRIALRLSVGILAAGIVATASLTGISGLVLTVFLLVWFGRRKARGVAVVLSVLVLVGLLSAPPIVERITLQVSVLREGDYLAAASNRGLAFYTAYRVAVGSPIFGVGPSRENVYDATVPHLPSTFLSFRERVGKAEGMEAHNAYLSILMETGIPGLVLFLALLGYVTLRLWVAVEGCARLRPHSAWTLVGQALLINLLVYMFQGLGNNTHNEKVLWLLLGAGVAYVSGLRSAVDREGRRAVGREVASG